MTPSEQTVLSRRYCCPVVVPLDCGRFGIMAPDGTVIAPLDSERLVLLLSDFPWRDYSANYEPRAERRKLSKPQPISPATEDDLA